MPNQAIWIFALLGFVAVAAIAIASLGAIQHAKSRRFYREALLASERGNFREAIRQLLLAERHWQLRNGNCLAHAADFGRLLLIVLAIEGDAKYCGPGLNQGDLIETVKWLQQFYSDRGNFSFDRRSVKRSVISGYVQMRDRLTAQRIALRRRLQEY